ISLDGKRVDILEDSSIVAVGGNVVATALGDGSRLAAGVYEGRPGNSFATSDPTDARIYVASGANIDVSGADAELAMERNSLRVELFSQQLADSPVQRDGRLYRQPVYVDVRQHGTREDGTEWWGSPLANLGASIASVPRDVRERNSLGGKIVMASQGDVIV